MNLEKYANEKGFRAEDLVQFGLRDQGNDLFIPYYDMEGKEYVRSRIVRDPTPDNPKGFWFTSGEGKPIPYGLNRPVKVTRGILWIVEGETDCWTLWLHGVPAVGLPGSTNFRGLLLQHLEGVNEVAIVEEPDKAGKRFPVQVANHLFDQGFKGKIYAVSLSAKDPRDLYIRNNGAFLATLREDFRLHAKLIAPPSGQSLATSSVSMADVFDMPLEDVEWIIDDLLPENGLGLLASAPKAGKSQLARNLALAVARGDRFLGRRCKQGLVFWVALEERRDQVIAAFKQLGATRDDMIRFHFGSAPADAMAWLHRECDTFNPILVVIDTWHKLTMVKNVNDYAEVNRANEPLMKLAREKGFAQLWIHHNKKGDKHKDPDQVDFIGDEVLGSQSLFAAVDTLLALKRDNFGQRTIQSIQRTGEDMEENVLEMNPETGMITSKGSKYLLYVESAKQSVLDILCHESLTRADIAKTAGMRRSIVLTALNELVREGIVVQASGSGEKGDPIRYRSAHSPMTQPALPIAKPEPEASKEIKEPPDLEGWETLVGSQGSQDLIEYAHTKGL